MPCTAVGIERCRAACMQACRCLDYNGAACLLEVRHDNAAALGLYSSVGFLVGALPRQANSTSAAHLLVVCAEQSHAHPGVQVEGKRRKFYEDGADAVLMTRPAGPLSA